MGMDSYSNNKGYEIKSMTNNYMPSFKPKNSFNKYVSALANIYPSVWAYDNMIRESRAY